MFITLPSDVDDPRWNATNTRAQYQTTLAKPLQIKVPVRACVYSIIYPKDWAYEGDSPPPADSRFFLASNLFRHRDLIGTLDRRISHVAPPQASGEDAIFAFLPEPAQANAQSAECNKPFLEYHALLPGPDIRDISVSIKDSLGRPIIFKKGTVVVTIHIKPQ